MFPFFTKPLATFMSSSSYSSSKPHPFSIPVFQMPFITLFSVSPASYPSLSLSGTVYPEYCYGEHALPIPQPVQGASKPLPSIPPSFKGLPTFVPSFPTRIQSSLILILGSYKSYHLGFRGKLYHLLFFSSLGFSGLFSKLSGLHINHLCFL